MQQIINDKLYDTEKSNLIYQYRDALVERDYYKSPKGTYFIHYLKVGRLEIVDEQVVKDILAERDVNKYIELFGKVAEG